MEQNKIKVQLFGILSSTISNTFYALRVPSSETKFKLKSRVKYNKSGNRTEENEGETYFASLLSTWMR